MNELLMLWFERDPNKVVSYYSYHYFGGYPFNCMNSSIIDYYLEDGIEKEFKANGDTDLRAFNFDFGNALFHE